MSDEIIQIFKDAGAFQEGHFLLASGLHSSEYWEKFRVLQFPNYTEKLCRMMAGHYREKNIEVVAGPTTGGVLLAYEVAKQLGVRGIFAEKEGDSRVFRRGFTIKAGERVLIVDDVLTTGGSVFDMIKAVNALKGNIIGIAVMVDRTRQKLDIDVPFFSCLKVDAPAYKPEECPLCQAGIPIVKPGSSQA
jgi:orotate phosphoribosyltransferase